MYKQYFNSLDDTRKKNNLLSLKEIFKLSETNVIYDPFSLLISRDVIIGKNNVFFPNISILGYNKGIIKIENNNFFHSTSYLISDCCKIIIGSNNLFGPGNISIKANTNLSEIVINNDCRFLNVIEIFGNNYFGNGSQVIGQISASNCILEDGGNFLTENPDDRGGVLKGYGSARNIKLSKGEVIFGNGVFDEKEIKKQSYYH